MGRFLLVFVLLIFSTNAVNAAAVLGCCSNFQQEKSAVAQTEPSVLPCHGEGDVPQKDKPSKYDHCLCTYTCAGKMLVGFDGQEFHVIPVGFSRSFEGRDILVSFFSPPDLPPPKI